MIRHFNICHEVLPILLTALALLAINTVGTDPARKLNILINSQAAQLHHMWMNTLIRADHFFGYLSSNK